MYPLAPTPQENAILDFFEEMRGKSIDNLEAGAREIIGLSTGLLGLLMGVVTLGGNRVAPSLLTNEARFLVLGVVGLLLLALGSALGVVLPVAYRYRPSSLDDQSKAYQKLLDRKAYWLRFAIIIFGLSILGFAILVGMIFWVETQ